MARLTKKQKAQYHTLLARAEAAERTAKLVDDFKFALIEFLREDITLIAREEAEEILSDAHISY